MARSDMIDQQMALVGPNTTQGHNKRGKQWNQSTDGVGSAEVRESAN